LELFSEQLPEEGRHIYFQNTHGVTIIRGSPTQYSYVIKISHIHTDTCATVYLNYSSLIHPITFFNSSNDAVGGMKIGSGNLSIQRKPVPVPF
jgi:hypothetical protein